MWAAIRIAHSVGWGLLGTYCSLRYVARYIPLSRFNQGTYFYFCWSFLAGGPICSDSLWQSQQIRAYLSAENFMSTTCCGLLFPLLCCWPDKDVLILWIRPESTDIRPYTTLLTLWICSLFTLLPLILHSAMLTLLLFFLLPPFSSSLLRI